MPKDSEELAFYRELGARIRKARVRTVRRDRHLSQDDLGRMVNLSRASISNIEGGRHQLKVRQLVKIARVLGVGLEALVPSDSIDLASMPDPKASPQASEPQLDRVSLTVVSIAKKRKQERANKRTE